MHPETKTLTQKHALSNTDRKSKATTKPWFSRLLRHPARKRRGSILGQTHTCLLTYLLAPDPHGVPKSENSLHTVTSLTQMCLQQVPELHTIINANRELPVILTDTLLMRQKFTHCCHY